MELRKWNYESDEKYIDSYLEASSKTYKIPMRSKEWFKWKFEKSPYGKALIFAAFDGEKVAGAVVFGFGKMQINRETVLCALSYDTFVDISYQGQHLFSKLIKGAFEECKAMGVKLIYNFPNPLSMPGFKKAGLIEVDGYYNYYTMPVCPVGFLKHFRDIHKGFIKNTSNYVSIKDTKIPKFSTPQIIPNVYTPIWTQEYIKWRFLSHPVSEYYIHSEGGVFAVAQVGYRGKIKESRILFITATEGKQLNRKLFYKTLWKIRSKRKCHLISMMVSPESDSYRYRQGFIHVKSHTNFGWFGWDISQTNFKIALNGVDSHTL